MAESMNMDELLDDELEARKRARGDYVEEDEDEGTQEDEDEETLTDSEENEESDNDEDLGPSEEDETGEEGNEEEGEGEETEEEESNEEEVDVEDLRIPKSRLDEVIQQREEYKERSAWLEERMEQLLESKTQEQVSEVSETPAPEFDFEAAEEEYGQALIEGEGAKAKAIRSKINKAQREETSYLIEKATREALESSSQRTSQVVEDKAYDDLVEVYENKHSFLDSKSEDYDADAVNFVNTLTTGMITEGKTKTKALRAAVTKVAKLMKPTAPESKPKAKTSVRRKQAVKRNIEASKRQVPKTSGVRNTTEGKVDIAKMSTKQFRKLSKRELAEARGDFLS